MFVGGHLTVSKTFLPYGLLDSRTDSIRLKCAAWPHGASVWERCWADPPPCGLALWGHPRGSVTCPSGPKPACIPLLLVTMAFQCACLKDPRNYCDGLHPKVVSMPSCYREIAHSSFQQTFVTPGARQVPAGVHPGPTHGEQPVFSGT